MEIILSAKDILLSKGYQFIQSPPFKSYFHHPDEHILFTIWHKESEFIDLETYKADAINTVKVVDNLNIKYLLTDNREGNFQWNYEVEEWYSENVIQKFPILGLKKLGVILDDSLSKMAYANSVIEEFLQENDVTSLESRFFNEFDKALSWIHH